VVNRHGYRAYRWYRARVLEVADATPADHDAIRSLTSAAFGEAATAMVEARLTGPQASDARWTVARDGERVVSTCVLLPFPLRIDGHPVPAGQIEFVATAPDYGGQGLVRRQFAVHHQRSTEAGHVIQLIQGIPYFYRRFGYGYGIGYPAVFDPQVPALRPDPVVTVRAATVDDLHVLVAFDRAHRPSDGLTTDWRAAHERLVWASSRSDPPGTGLSQAILATRRGEVVGTAYLDLEPQEQRTYLVAALTTDAGVTDAVLAYACRQNPGHQVLAHDTPGTRWSRRLREVGRPLPDGVGVYARIADPVAFLDALKPVLERRLAASPLSSITESITISRFADAVELSLVGGQVRAIRSVAPSQDPFVEDGCGVAPDWFPALVLGRWDPPELERRIDDISFGRHAEVIATLFPHLRSDLAGAF
jgi:predicted N-acetyltransferase YhbS